MFLHRESHALQYNVLAMISQFSSVVTASVIAQLGARFVQCGIRK